MSEPMPPDAARAIRVVVADVDGVMTDGGILLGAGSNGERIEMKRFHVRDGMAVHLLRRAGIEVAMVTGRQSHAVRLRAEELGITECHQGMGADKVAVVGDMLERREWAWHEVAYLADDLADVAALRRVGLPAAVADAVPEVRAEACWTSRRTGGTGAVREFAEALLNARNGWSVEAARYVAERGEAG